jgi:acetamidase/formamidase
VREDIQLTMPRAKTTTAWITMGFHEDLNQATVIALEGMLHLMNELFGYERKEALAIASLVVDLRITQIVNGFGVYMRYFPMEQSCSVCTFEIWFTTLSFSILKVF